MLGALSRYWAACAVLVAGVAITVALAMGTDANARTERADWLSTRGEVVVAGFDRSLRDALNDLEALAAFMEAKPDVTLDEFEAFLERVEVDQGLIGVAFIPEVENADRTAFEAKMQQTVPGYEIRQSAIDGSGLVTVAETDERERYYPVQYWVAGGSYLDTPLAEGAELFASQLQFPIYDINDAIGFDAGSEHRWADGLHAALTTREAAISGFIPLAEIDLADVVLVYVPVVLPNGEVAGTVAAPVVDVLLGGNLPGSLQQEIDWDVSTDHPDVVGPEIWDGELEVADRTWHFTVWARDDAATPFGTHPGRVTLLIGIAMTVLLAVTAQLALHWWRSTARVRSLQQLAAEKDRFIAVVSHELRTPLTAAFGLASELADRGEDFEPVEARDLMEVVLEQTAEAGHIIEDLLVAARSDIDKLTIGQRRVDLRSAIEHTRLSPVHDGIHYPEGNAVAWADPYRVRQIVRNLVSNAVRYGGDRIIVRCVENGTTASVLVADDGDGVPEDAREEIFAAYTTGEPDRYVTGSIGLGLYISRRLARRMGGDLVYRYEQGHSVFELKLPLATAADIETDAVVERARL